MYIFAFSKFWMRKVISILFLLVASLVILVHAVVPHHHHHNAACFEQTIHREKEHSHHGEEACCEHGQEKDIHNCLLADIEVLLPQKPYLKNQATAIIKKINSQKFQQTAILTPLENIVLKIPITCYHFSPHIGLCQPQMVGFSCGLRAPPIS